MALSLAGSETVAGLWTGIKRLSCCQGPGRPIYRRTLPEQSLSLYNYSHWWLTDGGASAEVSIVTTLCDRPGSVSERRTKAHKRLRERERETETETEAETETQREKERDRQTKRQTDRQTNRDRDRDTELSLIHI